MQPLTTLGDLIADLCLDVESFPILPPGHQTLSGLALGPGGAGNALIAAARLGLAAVALGSVGDDWIGARVLAHLNAEGVDAGRVVRQLGADTRTAVRLRAGNGEHMFLGRSGGLGPTTLPEAWAIAIAESGVLLVDGWSFFHSDPGVILQGVEVAARAGVPLLFDPGPRVGNIDHEWLRIVTRSAAVILATEPEHQALTRRLDLRDLRALKALRALILKLGPEGCVISTASARIPCPGYPVAARDATAAGDCFAAGVAWGLINQQPWDVIGAVANAVGAAKTGKVGTALAAPTRGEVTALLREHRPDLLAHWG